MAITFTAGQRVTAANLNSFVPKFIRKSADETVTASTTYQDDNDFAAISFGAGEIWVCETHLSLSSTLETGDLKIQWTQTGGASGGIRFQRCAELATTTATTTLMRTSVRNFTSSVPFGVDDDGTTFTYASEKFIVETTTAGTITMQWAQNAASGATTVRAGSFFVAHRVS